MRDDDVVVVVACTLEQLLSRKVLKKVPVVLVAACVVVVDIIIILLSLSLSESLSNTLSKKRKEGAGYDERTHLGDKIFPRRENFSFLGFQNFFLDFFLSIQLTQKRRRARETKFLMR